MKHIICLALILAVILCAGCGAKDAPGGEYSFSQTDFSGITGIRLQNCHNGAVKDLSDPEAIRKAARDTTKAAMP